MPRCQAVQREGACGRDMSSTLEMAAQRLLSGAQEETPTIKGRGL